MAQRYSFYTKSNKTLVEVHFKSTRKGYFVNCNNLPLKEGDIVAVEASPGHDLGCISLTGELVLRQLKKNKLTEESEFKKVYRLAKDSDLKKWEGVKTREYPTMIRARVIAKELNLKMKIGDVEFQGDGNKAIFFYIAESRVDFRELIKRFAEEFQIRVEMRQIGARQEAGRIGGLGPCGQVLCCSKWNTNFATVNTSAARFQGLSLNPQKLAGMCAKLKCCLNYEIDSYLEAQKQIPQKSRTLETEEGTYRHIKNDVLQGIMTYALKGEGASFVNVSKERVKEVLTLNNKGQKPEKLILKEAIDIPEVNLDFTNVVGEDDITRFDQKGEKRKKKKRNNKNRKFRPQKGKDKPNAQ